MSLHTSSTRSLWIVEDSQEYRSTVRDLFDLSTLATCTAAFGSAEALFEHLEHHFAPELILMDVGLPGMSGIEAVGRLQQMSPATAVLMLTVHDDNDRVFDAICSGASGYLLKSSSAEEIVAGVESALTGDRPMTPQIARRVFNLLRQVGAPLRDYGLSKRESQVLTQLTTGKSKAEIARTLFVSYHTVDTHVRNIYAKLRVHSRGGAVAKAVGERLVNPSTNQPSEREAS